MRIAGMLAVIAGGLFVVGVGAGLSCGDPVHDAEVTALGPEMPDSSPGPTHRAGQPCLTCHGGLGPGDQTFVTAGTVYLHAFTDAGALIDGSVFLTDSTGFTHEAHTNSVGNFYVGTDEWNADESNPVFPLGGLPEALTPHLISIAHGTLCEAGRLCEEPTMVTAIGRGGVYASCAYCHFDPPGPTSVGHISQNPNQ